MRNLFVLLAFIAGLSACAPPATQPSGPPQSSVVYTGGSQAISGVQYAIFRYARAYARNGFTATHRLVADFSAARISDSLTRTQLEDLQIAFINEMLGHMGRACSALGQKVADWTIDETQGTEDQIIAPFRCG